MKQFRIFKGLGGIQVQIQNSMFYVSLTSWAMLVGTFWNTVGFPIAYMYAPWFTFWHMVAIFIAGIITIAILDYKFIYPSRQAFQNEQSCKHDNPAMIEILKLKAQNELILKELAEIKRGIKP
jgi:hypothetical protein